MVQNLAEFARPLEPDLVLGAEARGFIFGPALAMELGVGFAAARKPGKLPYQTVRATYALEYGTDALEIHVDARQARQAGADRTTTCWRRAARPAPRSTS